MGVLAAVISAWVSSRSVARQDVVASIRSAEAPPVAVGRPWKGAVLTLLGLLVCGGGVLYARAQPLAGHHIERVLLPAIGGVVCFFLAALLAMPCCWTGCRRCWPPDRSGCVSRRGTGGAIGAAPPEWSPRPWP